MPADLELRRADGTWLALMLARERGQNGEVQHGAPKTVSEVMAAADAGLEVSKRLIPVISADWSRGLGLDYHEAVGVYTRTPGSALPAGAATDVALPAANNSASQLVAIRSFGSSLWVAQRGTGAAGTGRVMVSPDGTGAGAGAFVNTLTLGATEVMADLVVFGGVLYATSYSLTPGAGGRMHRWNGTGWDHTAPGDFLHWERRFAVTVFWVDQEGIGDHRLVVSSSGQGHISYTRPGGDPMVGTDWVEGVKTGSGAEVRLTSSRRHVYAGGLEGLFDLDEQGNSPNLMSYVTDLPLQGNAAAVQYFDGHVYYAVGTGLDRVRVDQGPILQETPGQCAPGWGTPAENAWQGATTALTVDQGYLVNAIDAAPAGRPAIFWGKDRTALGVETPNPLVWYGPECVGPPNTVVSVLRVASPPDAGFDLRLWVGSGPPSPFAPGPTLTHISLPAAGAPLQNLAAGGAHRFTTGSGVGTAWNTRSHLQLMDEVWDDQASMKHLQAHAVVSRGLDDPVGTKLVFETRADPPPGSAVWTTSDDVTVSPMQEVAPVLVSGHKIGRRISFVSPNGASSPARVGVLDAVRTTAWRVVPSYGVRSLWVEYGDAVTDQAHASPDGRSPDQVTADLEAITRMGRTTLRDREGGRWTVKLEQVLDRETTLSDSLPYRRSVRARLEISVIEAL